MARARAERPGTEQALRLGERVHLVVKDVVADTDGTRHVRYDRTFAGLPVIGGDLVVHEGPGRRLSGVEWSTERPVAVASTEATVAPTDAAARSARATGLRDTGAPRKVVYAVQHRPVLAWETTVTGTDAEGGPVESLVYTDARSGRLLGTDEVVKHADGTGYSQYSGTVTLKTSLSGSTYQLTDATRGGHRTHDANGSTSQTATGTLFTDADNTWGNGSTSSRQTAAVDAHYGAAVTWDLYRDLFGRSGIRGDGAAAYSKVHYGSSYENAFWYDPCFCMTYGDGGSTLNALTSLDVAGHEMSHGLTSSTAGLVYSGDAGGLNEATSDVMGTMVEFKAANSSDPGDYYIGEKIYRTSGGYLRRMDNPAADGASVNCWSTSTAGLDPHYSSGVGNHAFYLMAEGSGTKTIGGRTHTSSTCNGTSVTGIGRDAAAKIWYRALSAYMTSTTTYPQAAGYLVRAAKDLYGASSTQCVTTLAAWKGVSTSTSETCGTSTPPPTGGNLLANPGFESAAVSWSATSGAITNATGGSPRSGSWYAWLDGYGAAHTDYVQQSVAVPAAARATLSLYLWVASDETTTGTAYDTLKVQVLSGGTTSTLATYSNLDKGSGYVLRTVDLSAFTGRTVTVKLLGVEDASLGTSFLIDDVVLSTS
ncbi:M4 family metallopeptidase [Nocardioides mesophilus]|uniref:M4 family metallopeptidase n=1 Tax=Nocardioides mesophilus TaxID=433659 RepID=UPI001CB6FFB0|nr:M4 family metallopeptidase [Nocardioides mesophilus]